MIYSMASWSKSCSICIICHSVLGFIHSFTHSDYFCSASSSPLLHSTDTMSEFHTRQLRVKNLPKVPTWWLERDSNPWPFRQKAYNLPMSHYAPLEWILWFYQFLSTFHHTYQFCLFIAFLGMVFLCISRSVIK